MRVEGSAQLAVDLGDASRPMKVSIGGRASYERDYRSYSAALAFTGAFLERTTTHSLSTGVGVDTLSPDETPSVIALPWPNTHRGWILSLDVDRLLSRRLAFSGGAAVTFQTGQLSSPYRRAEILRGSGYFRKVEPVPEAHPDERWRGTAYGGLRGYAGDGGQVLAHLGSVGIQAEY